jgi:YHS domain-containing protein
MNRFLVMAVMASFVVLAGGCKTAGQAEGAAAGDSAQATCCVCQYNNDLSCVAVRVKDTTPRTDYGGKTYFFCSSGCRSSFEKKPQKYLAKF